MNLCNISYFYLLIFLLADFFTCRFYLLKIFPTCAIGVLHSNRIRSILFMLEIALK